MTLILGDHVKMSQWKPGLDMQEWAKQVDHDLQRLFIALRPSLVVVLLDAAQINTDASISFHFRVTLGGDRQLMNPTNGRDGQFVQWEIVQDTVGNRSLTYDTKFAFGTDVTTPTLSTTAGAIDKILACYDSIRDKWDVVAFIKGYT